MNNNNQRLATRSNRPENLYTIFKSKNEKEFVSIKQEFILHPDTSPRHIGESGRYLSFDDLKHMSHFAKLAPHLSERVIGLDNRGVAVNRHYIELKPKSKELRICKVMFREPERAWGYDVIYARIWRIDEYDKTLRKKLTNFIAYTNKKLGAQVFIRDNGRLKLNNSYDYRTDGAVLVDLFDKFLIIDNRKN